MCIRRAVALIAALLLLSCIAQAQDKMLTLDDIFDPQKRINFNVPQPQITWLADGNYYLQGNSGPDLSAVKLIKVEAATGRSEPFLTSTQLSQALVAAGTEVKDVRALEGLTFNKSQTAVLLNYSNDLYYYELGSPRAIRLTSTPEPETDESFSPDGRSIGFVRNFNIYVVDVAAQKERPLTTNGNKDLLNGRLDWVYEEEIYGRGVTQGYWWSPDSAVIAFLSLDETGVQDFDVIDHIPVGQEVEVMKYPKAGQTNPRVKLGVVNASGGDLRWIDLATYQSLEFLITRVGWTPDSKNVIFEVQNREQTWLDLNLGESRTAGLRTLLREVSRAWVEVVELPQVLDDGSFLWQSDRSGWRHIYHYSADGKLIRQLTTGQWDVREFFGVSSDNWIYFSAGEHSSIADDIYRVKLDGTGFARISQDEGNHRADFNPQFTTFVGTWSSISTPTQIRLHKSDGTIVRVIEEGKIPRLAEYRLSKPELLNVKARDGFVMEAMMIKPPNFDPNKKYPVLIHSYAGPGAPTVRNTWGAKFNGGIAGYMWHQMLAQRGYIIWVCDNRSASQKGMQSQYPVFRNLGELELQDLEDSITWLKSQSFIDANRIGLWGWSYGGFMTAYALTHSKSFKMGIAGAPVTDWRNYDTVYTERYMGRPQDNLEGYRKSSVLEAAKDLHGKLLIIHGTIDDNVHLQNTIQFVNVLQLAGKHFDLMLYPKSRHGVTQPLRVKHLREIMTNFILENL
jgi:dipeptidyl-peptidase 4